MIDIDGTRYVWDVFENAWVTLDYWRWVNGRVAAEGIDPEELRTAVGQMNRGEGVSLAEYRAAAAEEAE